MRVLVLSQEVWRNDTNGGNVLSSVLGGLDAEFAQIYCSHGIPDNSLCTRYYQMTDAMAMKCLLHKGVMGNQFDMSGAGEEQKPASNTFSGYALLKHLRFESFLILKELIWKISSWKNKQLENFILNFQPDIIFAPCYGTHFMLSLTEYVEKLTKKTIISYISDDSYSLLQFRMSPLYWIHKFSLRRHLRKVFPLYSMVYTMTEEQKLQCEKEFGANMKILRKGAMYPEIKNNTSSPLRMIYAGNIFYGRIKTLKAIAQAIGYINRDSVKITLDIYTANQLTKWQRKALNNDRDCFLHKPVSKDTLCEEYLNHDLALHVESFKLRYRLISRMSFSTKIVDCLASSCAVMAICWDRHAGFTYLRAHDAAICVSSLKQLKSTFESLIADPRIIQEYREKARECVVQNHDPGEVDTMVYEDFHRLNK